MSQTTSDKMLQEDAVPAAQTWRKSILGQLRNRNQREITPFQDLIHVHNRIVERISSLQMENTQLSFINEKLKEEIRNLRISPTAGTAPNKDDIGANVPTSSAEAIATQSTITMLEKKLFAIQEELTEMHRRKGKCGLRSLVLIGQLIQQYRI